MVARMEGIVRAVKGIAAIAALSAALEMLLPDGAAKKGVELIARLAMALAVASMLAAIVG